MSSKDITYIALFTSLTIVFAIIPPIPMPLVPVPLTLQTLGVMLAGLVLGPRLALISMALYLVIALVGFPVLPGGRSGLAVFAGPTGGFLLGFLPGAFVTGWMARRSMQLAQGQRSGAQIFASNLTASILGGALTVYVIGVPWLAMVTDTPLSKAVLAVAIFMPGDVIKALIAAFVATRLAQLMPAAGDRQ
ncbi:biotin transporter BioY [Orrella daihaiensis]|uniref:Biotin transporter n=1 Tax=Orrella daihaiensis TaxID=2782176 RepID=A0ABY4APX3_9BURK|nr:biotin transporter BioY [Orrella daihaiensis]UOD51671.1 biotin transporter BioY [Orrella daihaiensis]